MAKFLTRLVLVLIGMELAYLVLINVFLSTSIGPAIVNLKPEKFQLRWDSGWSVVPGLINAQGVKLRVQTPRMQWYLEVDGGNLWVRWWKLPLKHFEATGIEAEGLSFYLRHRLPAGSKPAQPDLTPDIPGLTNPPQVYPSPPRGRPWHILIESSRARRLKEIWVEQFRVTGHDDSELELGRYSIITRGGPSALSDVVLEIGGASLAVGKDILARDLQVKAKPTLDPTRLLGATPAQVNSHISGTASITGRLGNLETLNHHFPGLPIRIESESNFDFAADVELDHGALVAGSKALVNAREVTADYLQYQVKGAGALHAEVSGQGEDTATRLELELGDVSLAVGKDILARDLQVKARHSLDPANLRGATLAQVASRISGTVSTTGRMSNLETLNLLFQGLPIRIENDGEFDFTADVELDHGALVAGSKALVNVREVTADYLQYQVKGAGVLRGEVSGHGKDTVTRLELALDKYILGDREGDAYLIDNGFQMVATVNNLGLVNPGHGLKVVATRPQSTIPNLAYFNNLLPAALGLKIEQGTGQLHHELKFDKDDETITGEIRLHLDDFIARYRSLVVSGNLEAQTRLKRGNLEAKVFNATGTRIQLRNITVTDDKSHLATDWWGKIHLSNAEMDLQPDLQVWGDVEIQMRDTGLVLALFEKRKELPNWVERILTVENVNAQSKVEWANDIVDVTDFELHGEEWLVLGDLIMKPRSREAILREGLLYMHHRHLGLAIEHKGGHKHAKLIHARKWFDKHRAALRAAGE